MSLIELLKGYGKLQIILKENGQTMGLEQLFLGLGILHKLEKNIRDELSFKLIHLPSDCFMEICKYLPNKIVIEFSTICKDIRSKTINIVEKVKECKDLSVNWSLPNNRKSNSVFELYCHWIDVRNGNRPIDIATINIAKPKKNIVVCNRCIIRYHPYNQGRYEGSIVCVRYTFNNWKTFEDKQVLTYIDKDCKPFDVYIGIRVPYGKTLQFASYIKHWDNESWDNNNGKNHTF